MKILAQGLDDGLEPNPSRRMNVGPLGNEGRLTGRVDPLPERIDDLDRADPLRSFRSRFSLPDGLIYLDGNSLGALPVETAARMASAIKNEWGAGLIESWNTHDWIGLPQRVGAKIAKIIGADEHEVVVADSTSVNLFKLIVAALMHQRGRSKIISEPGNFPTDLYIAQGASMLMDGHELVTLPADEIEAAIDEDTAVVVLTHVHYKTGRKLDMARITQKTHDMGALIIWDLSHSAGAVSLDLKGSGVDLAVGCGYKYLNGGPGAPAFLFVSAALQPLLNSPLSGWMGHSAPFEFVDAYSPAAGIDRFLCGTPSILGMVALEVGVDIHLEADINDIHAKSVALSSLFIELVRTVCGEHDFRITTPDQAVSRGSHVALAHEHAYEICQALIARGVVGDFRAPNTLRFGFTPLYTSYADVWRSAHILADIMTGRLWDNDQFRARLRVT